MRDDVGAELGQGQALSLLEVRVGGQNQMQGKEIRRFVALLNRVFAKRGVEVCHSTSFPYLFARAPILSSQSQAAIWNPTLLRKLYFFSFAARRGWPATRVGGRPVAFASLSLSAAAGAVAVVWEQFRQPTIVLRLKLKRSTRMQEEHREEETGPTRRCRPL